MRVNMVIIKYYIHSTFCTFQPLAVIPKLAAQGRKTRAPNANGVGTALSYGSAADARDRIEAWGGSEAQKRQLWRGLDITTEARLGITQLCVYTFRLVSDAACRGTMGMVRGCAEDARCHTAHMSSLTYESRLNAGYWLCLRGPTGSQTFQQQQRECSEVDAARRRAPWIPKLSEYLQQHLYTALIGMHLCLRADHTTEPCIKRIWQCIAWSFAVGWWRSTRSVYMILMTRII